MLTGGSSFGFDRTRVAEFHILHRRLHAALVVVRLVIGAVLAEGEAACLSKRLVERLLQEHVVLAVHFLLSPRKVLVVVVLACC